MATDLISTITQFLTPDMISRIAVALGLDRSKAQTAIGAAIPALLAGLSGVATQPGGAQRLADAARQQSSVLDSFAGSLARGDQPSLIEQGSRLLSSLLGSRDEATLATAVSKFAGLTPNAGGSLLGMLAPLVMGGIARQGGHDPTAGSLSKLLASEKNNILSAIPAGLGDMLSGSAFDAVTDAARSTASAARHTAREATTAAYSVGNAGHRAASAASTSSVNWLYWALPLVVLAGLLTWWLSQDRVVQTTTPSMQGLTVGGIDVGRQMTDSVSNLRTMLNGISDAASAEAALPKLREVAGQVDRVSERVAQLTPEQRRQLSAMVNPSMTTLTQLIDRVLAIPGVGPILKPTLDNVKTKLVAMA